MEAFMMGMLMFGWDIMKIWLTVKAAWGAYLLYGLHEGTVVISA